MMSFKCVNTSESIRRTPSEWQTQRNTLVTEHTDCSLTRRSVTEQHEPRHNTRVQGRLVQPLLIGVQVVDGTLFLSRNCAALKFQLATIQHGPGQLRRRLSLAIWGTKPVTNMNMHRREVLVIVFLCCCSLPAGAYNISTAGYTGPHKSSPFEFMLDRMVDALMTWVNFLYNIYFHTYYSFTGRNVICSYAQDLLIW